jgi:hypothetical protein
LKPANVLVTKGGVKLLDFGLAAQCVPLQEAVSGEGARGMGRAESMPGE